MLWKYTSYLFRLYCISKGVSTYKQKNKRSQEQVKAIKQPKLYACGMASQKNPKMKLFYSTCDKNEWKYFIAKYANEVNSKR